MNTFAPCKALLKEMQMTNVIINFRRHLKRRNYSPHTVKYYLNILKQFVIWLDVAIEQATDKKIDAYIDYLHCEDFRI